MCPVAHPLRRRSSGPRACHVMADLIAPTTASVALRPHPVYQTLEPVWRLLAHAVEGTGGFLDGTALIAHPREYLDHAADAPTRPTKKLLERRKLARYENWPKTILRLVAGAIFRTPPVRRVGPADSPPHPLELWWGDVDGHGTSIDAYLAKAWRVAGTFGHVFVVFDRPADQARTAADARAPFLRLYTPLDVPDWLTDESGHLTAVSLLEVLPRTSFDQSLANSQLRYLTREGWEVRQRTGAGLVATQASASGDYDYGGALPVVVLYGQTRELTPVVGQSILGDPHIYVDDYNLSSAIRELLRKQTFSILNVPLGTGPDAVSTESAQQMLGTVTGTANVAFTPLAADYISPSAENIVAYQSEQDRVRRTMFRQAGLPYETDSRDAKSADAIRLEREDLNQTLAGYADFLEHADRQIAQLWFRATYGARGQQEWDRAQVAIAWPDTFDSEVLDDLIARVAEAISLRLGKTATDKLRLAVATKLLPEADEPTLQTIASEIEAMPDPEEERAAQRAQMIASLTGGNTPPRADDAGA